MRLPPAVLLLLAACAGPPLPRTAPPPRSGDRTPPEAPEPMLLEVAAALRAGRVDRARNVLERGRWYASDRARAVLLLAGCRLLGHDAPGALDAVREYLAKTPRLKTPYGRLALRLLRHDATGGGLRAETATEACYFGLYALFALDERETARPDLERALAGAPEPERLLARVARDSGYW